MNMTDNGEAASDRLVLEVSGPDRSGFLQGLVTNDLGRLRDGLVYAALLTPQGKYLADFFLVPAGDTILVDAHAHQAGALQRRLMMYKLRANVSIVETPLFVRRGLGVAPIGAFADPRHPALGWRSYGAEPGKPQLTDWDAIRVANGIPEAGSELIPDESYILEAGFERLNGVDFRKGCYVGQEVTARMKHKTELRKGFVTVQVEGDAAPGTAILSGDKTAGQLCTRSGNRAIAWLRFDRMDGELRAGDARILPER